MYVRYFALKTFRFMTMKGGMCMCINETIKESNVVEDQLIISNTLFVLKELYTLGEIDRETYVSNLQEAYTVLRG